MKDKDRRTTLVIIGVVNWEYEFRTDTMRPTHRRWEVCEFEYNSPRKLRFTGTFDEACDFLVEHARPFTPPILKNHNQQEEP